ncbi:MAG: DUF3810 family protein [Gemmatimonadales bacterium]|nr:MAG: DUF3810 family protein [Gemmatimonadales bacterium]
MDLRVRGGDLRPRRGPHLRRGGALRPGGGPLGGAPAHAQRPSRAGRRRGGRTHLRGVRRTRPRLHLRHRQRAPDSVRSDPPLPWGWHVGLALGLAGWVGWRILADRPELAEAVAGRGLLPRLSQALSLATGWIPVSLAEFVVLGVVGALGWSAAGELRRRRRSGRRDGGARGPASAGPGASAGAGGRIAEGNEPVLRLLRRGALRILRDAGVLFFLFQLLWGFGYARPGLADRLEITAAGEAPALEVRSLAAALVIRTNELRAELEAEGRADPEAPLPALSHRSLVRALEPAWLEAADRWPLPPEARWRMGAPKPLWASEAVRRLGIAGIYFPYTGEALVVAGRPASAAPRDLAHEMAHQRGIAREDDANATAYLVGLHAEDAAVRYAVALFIQRQALNALLAVDPAAVRRLVEARSPGVQADVRDQVEWSREVAGTPVARVASAANDRMLRSHGIDEGIRSYQGSLWIVLALARREGLGAILPPVGGGASP